MNDIDWFVSLMTKEDMIFVMKTMKIPIDGFQRNPEKAPYQILEAEIRNFLQGKRGKRRKGSLIYPKFVNRMKEIILYKTKNNIEQNDVEKFYMQMEMNEELRPFEKIILFQSLYPTEYDDKLSILVTNSKNNLPLFNGFTKDLDPILKIETLIKPDIPSRLFEIEHEKLRSWLKVEFGHEELVKFKEIVLSSTEEDFIQNLFSKTKKEKLALVFLFLNEKNRYKNPKYENIVYYFLQTWHKFMLNSLQKNVYKKNLEFETLYKELDVKKKQLSKINREMELLKDKAKKYLEEISIKDEMNKNQEILVRQSKQQISTLARTCNDLEKQKEDLYQKVIQYEGIIEKVRLLLGGYEWKIVTNYKNDFPFLTSLFNDRFLSSWTLDNMIKQKTVKELKEHILFVSRRSFTSSRIYVDLMDSLHENQIKTKELLSNSEIDNLKIIMSELLSKEGERIW